MTFLKLFLIVLAVLYFSKTPVGQKIGNFLPTPFWIYFIPILFTTFEWLPKESPAYDFLGLHALAAALVLMLIGTPVSSLIKLGPRATAAMAIASFTMVVGTIISFGLFTRFLPAESYKAAGAILATWVGGRANMIAVKELLNIPDNHMAPLIIVDTVLSYTWMALLILGAGYQRVMDRWLVGSNFENSAETFEVPLSFLPSTEEEKGSNWMKGARNTFLVLAIGFIIGELAVFCGRFLGIQFPLLSGKGWAILMASTISVLLAMTPLHKLEKWNASRWGMYVLYLVLASIGAKTTLHAALDAPVFLLFGVGVLLIHGTLTLFIGRIFKIPLYLLSVASQAAVGGPVSAPIVAGVYRPGIAHMGVLMAIMGAIVGTYVGLLGSWLCHFLELFVGK